jgi:transposase
MRALELKQQGWKQRDIATALGVTAGAVSQWLAAARAGGPAALRSRPVPGAPARLTATQRDLLPELLWHGAEAYGFRGAVWTCTRVAHVISRQFGVTYSKSQVSRLLAALNWTPQLPIERAIQRDEAAIAHWRVAVWPALHAQAQQERRALVFVDEAGFYLLAGVVKTYAPSGQTPVLAAWQTRDHLSVMGGLTPTGQIYMLVREEALTGLETLVFLQHLLRHAGERLLVIWDRVADPLAGGGPRLREQSRRAAHCAGEVARLCPRSEPLGCRCVAASQTRGVGQRGPVEFGSTAFGTRPGHWPRAPETRTNSELLSRRRTGAIKL